MTQLGVPYVWGGASPSVGFDCSGLASWAYAQIGKSVPHYTGAIWSAFPHVAGPLEPGDMLFFNGGGHMGIYIGDGQFVHAPHTGDVVRQDADGMLYFVDRKKNIIRRSGENIAAAEVEAVLQAHASVAQVAVLAAPDELREEEVMACVVPMPGATPGPALADELFRWCQERLAYFKAPGWIVFVATLPTTGTQKIQKTQIFARDEDPRRHPAAFDLRERKRRRRPERRFAAADHSRTGKRWIDLAIEPGRRFHASRSGGKACLRRRARAGPAEEIRGGPRGLRCVPREVAGSSVCGERVLLAR